MLKKVEREGRFSLWQSTFLYSFEHNLAVVVLYAPFDIAACLQARDTDMAKTFEEREVRRWTATVQ